MCTVTVVKPAVRPARVGRAAGGADIGSTSNLKVRPASADMRFRMRPFKLARSGLSWGVNSAMVTVTAHTTLCSLPNGTVLCSQPEPERQHPPLAQLCQRYDRVPFGASF